ncbi:MAG: hypothetical protein CMH30_00800 [Micavibrio sp.]|nr:hypothetical protein [Micavibrio sp.]
MDKLLTLLDLQKQAQKAQNLTEFSFAVVNNTQKLIPYKQAVFWTYHDGGVMCHGLSGNAVLDPNGPYATALKRFIKTTLIKHSPNEPILSLTNKDLPENDKEEWQNLFSKTVNLALFTTEHSGIIGGLWLETDKAYSQAEKDVLTELCESYAYSLSALTRSQHTHNIRNWFKAKKNRRVIAIVAIAVFFFPTQLTITAPAEIVAASPKVISVPYDGILEKITVKPGESVKQGDIIALMDDTTIEAQVEQAAQALKTAQVSLSKTGIESLRDQDSQKKADLQLLRAEIATKRVELEYAKTLFDKTSIKALADGVAIFADRNSIEGKPMKTGEKLMLIANPNDTELLIRIPIDSLLPISEKSKTSFYLNVTPLSSYRATIKSIGYQASPDPDGLLTYKMRADIKQKDKDLRIGWKGTAKIKSNWSILGYAVLRKPLIALRNLLGL